MTDTDEGNIDSTLRLLERQVMEVVRKLVVEKNDLQGQHDELTHAYAKLEQEHNRCGKTMAKAVQLMYRGEYYTGREIVEMLAARDEALNYARVAQEHNRSDQRVFATYKGLSLMECGQRMDEAENNTFKRSAQKLRERISGRSTADPGAILPALVISYLEGLDE